MSAIILTGGGTAGHIIPNLALVPELKKHFDKIYYIGGNGMEKELVVKAGLPFFETETVKFDRSKLLSNIKIPFTLSKGIKQAEKILAEIKPDVVFAKGGYVSLPACYAAKRSGIPVVIHESDMSLGMANKLVSKFAAAVLTSFEETQGGIYTGNPVREEIFSGSGERARINYKINTPKPVVLIVGGSSGSRAVNELVYKAAPKLSENFFIVHLSGKNGDFSHKNGSYLQLPYAHDIPDLFALASVVVTRAGANALAELSALGKKTLAIPLPKGSSRGDQLENALSYQKRGLLTAVEQSELTPERLVHLINGLYSSPPPNAGRIGKPNEVIVKQILAAKAAKK